MIAHDVKFCGKRTYDGKMVTGDLLHDGDRVFIMFSFTEDGMHTKMKYFRVEPESVYMEWK